MLTITSLVLDSGVIPRGSGAYPYFTAVQNGFTSALCTCLVINGFVGFQLYEDGTTLSVWLLRLTSLGMFVVSGAVSLLTFKGWAGLGPTNTVGLFVVLYIINGLCVLVYVVMQIILVTYTLQDRWPLGDIAFGIFFFVIGQLIVYVFGDGICRNVQHYLDGLFFATICNLLGVMMVYKVWQHLHFHDKHGMLTCSLSTGIPSPEKISSSVLVRSRTIGRSRSCCRKTNVETPSTTMAPTPSMPAAPSISQETRHTVASITEVANFFRLLFYTVGKWFG